MAYNRSVRVCFTLQSVLILNPHTPAQFSQHRHRVLEENNAYTFFTLREATALQELMIFPDMFNRGKD